MVAGSTSWPEVKATKYDLRCLGGGDSHAEGLFCCCLKALAAARAA